METVTLTIPAPVARYGEDVEVLNWKKKHGDNWEPAMVIRAEFCMSAFIGQELKGRWTYTVLLQRKNPRGQGMTLHCGEDQIRRIAQ